MYSKELISQVIKTNKYNIHVATCWVEDNQLANAQEFLDKYLQCDIELNQYLNDEITFVQMSPNSIMYFYKGLK